VIQSANNNGSDIQSIFEYPESFQNPQYYGIDIDVCNVFFSDWQNGIFKISRFNGSPDNGTVSTPVINETSVNGLKLYRGYREYTSQWDLNNGLKVYRSYREYTSQWDLNNGLKLYRSYREYTSQWDLS